MKKLISILSLFLILSGVSYGQTNCECDTAQPDTSTFNPAPYSFHFDGYNNRSISFGDALDNVFTTELFSVRTTFRMLNTAVSGVRRTIWSKWKQTGNQRGCELIIENDRRIIFRLSPDGAANAFAKGAIQIPTTGFHDVVIVYNKAGSTNADKLQLYVDGVKDVLTFTGTFGNIFSNSANLFIGLEDAGTTYDQLNAYVNHFAITSDQITEAEADTLWNGGKPLMTDSICNNIVLLPDFPTATFGGTNWSIPDSSGNGLTGTTALMGQHERVEHQNPYEVKKVILVALFGQSNQLGNAANSGLAAVYKEKRFDVKMWQGSSFSDLTTSTNTFPSINTGLHAAEFAHGWSLADQSGYDVYFVKYAVGGTSMYNYWKYNAQYYNEAVETLDSVICYMEENSINYDLIIDYNQGEHDSQDTTKANAYHDLYSAQLDSLIAHYPCLKGYTISYTRSNLGTGFDYASTVHDAQDSVITTKNDPYFIGIDIDDLNPGLLHLTATGYKTNGIRKTAAQITWY